MKKYNTFPLIILELKGGFGNLLFQISAAYKFSKEHNARIVIFDESNTKNMIIKNFLNLTFDKASKLELFLACKEIKKDNFLLRISKRIMKKTGLHFARYFHGGNFEPLRHNKKYFKKKIIYLDGYYQHPDFYNDSISYIEKIYRGNNKILNNTNEQTTIHLRRADYINHGWDLPIDYYINSLESIDPHRKYKIKIISDDYFAAIGLENICSNMGFDIIENTNFQDRQNFVEMVNSKNIIMSNSSFSLWASMLSQKIYSTKNRCITYPKGWLSGFNDVLGNDDWITIDSNNLNARKENYGNSLEFYTKQNQNKLEI